MPEAARLPRVQIKADRPVGTSAQILLDGQPVPGVTAVEVHMSAADVNLVTLHLIAGELEIDAPAMVKTERPVLPRSKTV